jgi:fructose/tagatose bisphosphate aldolase
MASGVLFRPSPRLPLGGLRLSTDRSMIVTTAQLYKVAYGKFAVGAYNINNAEQTMGLFRGCIESQAPFIIQISKGARKYTDKRMLEAIIRAAEGIFPEAIFAVHLDHGDEETCYDCIGSGFYSSVMIDASHDPFDKNAEITKRVVDKAHAKGISVEAELGMLGGVEEDIAVDEGNACLTNPDEAVEFIKRTGCDALAAPYGEPPGDLRAAHHCPVDPEAIPRITWAAFRAAPRSSVAGSVIGAEWLDRSSFEPTCIFIPAPTTPLSRHIRSRTICPRPKSGTFPSSALLTTMQ